MAAPVEQPALDLAVTRRAAAHWRDTAADRQRRSAAAAAHRYTEADDPARLAAHANRLLRGVRRRAPADPEDLPPVLRQELARGGVSPGRLTDRLFEAIIGESRDFLAIGFLEGGLRAARAVGRVVVRPPGRRGLLGTGFLVSPRVMLTNHHVVRSIAEASATTLEMGFDVSGGPGAEPIRSFALRPDALFITDAELDFSLIAVAERAAGGGALAEYGFLPLIAEEGKIVVGRPVNIIQHPRGRAKEVVIRENRLLNMPASPNWAAHYEADTEPGSSGSPVLNDAWEVIALHHSGVPKTDAEGRWLDIDGGLWTEEEDPARIAWVGNEGIRVSRLIGRLSTAPVQRSQLSLRDEVLRAEQMPRPPVGASIDRRRGAADRPAPATPPQEPAPVGGGPLAIAYMPGADAAGLTLTVPLLIRLSLGAGTASPDAAATQALLGERLEIDPDYASRPGFDPDFCGFHAPLPVPGPRIAELAAETEGGGFELRYFNYSVIMNRERRLAFVAAVNFDSEAPARFDRGASYRWVFDPRLPEEFQAGNEFYVNNPLDRGHLARRRDAAWGRTEVEAKRANDDTFHFTNCAPQHEVFNQSDRATRRGLLLWGNLENHILASAMHDRERVSVFNGPIFRDDDRTYRGLPIPRQFFKVLAVRERVGRRAANRVFAFVLSQEPLIRRLPEEAFTPEEAFAAGPFKPYQVSLAEIERRTGLLFGPAMRGADVLRRRRGARPEESEGAPIEIATLADLVRPEAAAPEPETQEPATAAAGSADPPPAERPTPSRGRRA